MEKIGAAPPWNLEQEEENGLKVELPRSVSKTSRELFVRI